MKPNWLIKKSGSLDATHTIKAKLRNHKLHTVCEEARCPNLGECFSRGTATFLILGDICTRSCKFCNVKSSHDHLKPAIPDPNEPANIAQMVKELGLRHVVITSVTRDDLPDEGAGQFAKTIQLIRATNPPTIEVLTPDFHSRADCLETVCGAGPNIFNHNVETVRRLTPLVRSNADYDRSLSVLRWVGSNHPDIVVKSGLMVGLGEREEEVIETLSDLCKSSCKIVTIGQYLKPKSGRFEVVEYVRPEVFERYKAMGEKIGIKYMFSGPFVRSSYMADAIIGGHHGS